MTMFNIMLILAGILEYILLGIDFKDNFVNNFANPYLCGILIAVAFLNTIPAADLILGDVVLVRVGDKTPADIVLFSATDLKVDNSSLTGESELQERRPLPSGSPSHAISNSTLVINGEGWGVVARTGDHTLIVQVARLTSGEAGNEAPLAIEIGRFVIQVSHIAIVFAIVFFVVRITTVYKGSASFVPEGLLSVVTLLLSIAAKRMAKQNVLVKDLQGVETLGAFALLGSNNDDQETMDVPGMREMVDIAALSSRVKFDKTDVPFMEILGDATETSLTRFAGRCPGSDYDAHLKKYPKVLEGAKIPVFRFA
ncbi:hypothetical protein K435DRAFT_869894 [Dendrothele bispora CBS 962.96]|uniref:P-type ATPase A domain-containing protein n=1 Tax=Dendrothele bispora (strain CBS 962.96) TaxID=1314807 RepID=A0A4S8L8Q8_DENBC|nr:hypothetical protein K435DRAFT_869894 [Dendrothele bispora CBS 962.96]